eukprot:361009-Chlamydomonas_euryale.AAC.2
MLSSEDEVNQVKQSSSACGAHAGKKVAGVAEVGSNRPSCCVQKCGRSTCACWRACGRGGACCSLRFLRWGRGGGDWKWQGLVGIPFSTSSAPVIFPSLSLLFRPCFTSDSSPPTRSVRSSLARARHRNPSSPPNRFPPDFVPPFLPLLRLRFVASNAQRLLNVDTPNVLAVSSRLALSAKLEAAAERGAAGAGTSSLSWEDAELAERSDWAASGFGAFESFVYEFLIGRGEQAGEGVRLKLQTPLYVADALMGACGRCGDKAAAPV